MFPAFKFPIGMWGFSAGIFAELCSLDQLILIRVKPSFNWLVF